LTEHMKKRRLTPL